jgi:hypothetical protein
MVCPYGAQEAVRGVTARAWERAPKSWDWGVTRHIERLRKMKLPGGSCAQADPGANEACGTTATTGTAGHRASPTTCLSAPRVLAGAALRQCCVYVGVCSGRGLSSPCGAAEAEAPEVPVDLYTRQRLCHKVRRVQSTEDLIQAAGFGADKILAPKLGNG